MFLEKDEEKMLEGEEGEAKRRAMNLLVRYGEALDAERLIDVSSVHFMEYFDLPFSGTKLQDETIKFLLATEESTKVESVKVFTTAHIQRCDFENWRTLGIKREEYEKLNEMKKLCKRLGINCTFTCVPYLTGNVPTPGEHIAWMESSAVPIANSVLGARGNLEGSESSFAAAITGKIPYWGLHKDEERYGDILVDVKANIESVNDWDMLGYYIGEVVGEKIPVLKGSFSPNKIQIEHLKSFSASLNTSGGSQMFHIPGKTFGTNKVEDAFSDKPEMKIHVTESDLKAVKEKISTGVSEKVDLITLGCPHCTIHQLSKIAKLLNNKKVRKDVKLWIWTAHGIKTLSDRMGYTNMIESSGGEVHVDTCAVPSAWDSHNIGTVATDSCKQAHYLPRMHNVDVVYDTIENCIDMAF